MTTLHAVPNRFESATAPGVDDAEVLQFRSYRVIPAARLVLSDGQPVKLGSRAFDLLVALLRARGTILSRDDLIRKVWPSIYVDETNLRFQMGVLRRALGSDCDVVTTIPGRGYLLVAEVASIPLAAPAAVLNWEACLACELDADIKEAVRELMQNFAEALCRTILRAKPPASVTRRIQAPRQGAGCNSYRCARRSAGAEDDCDGQVSDNVPTRPNGRLDWETRSAIRRPEASDGRSGRRLGASPRS